MRKPDWWIDCIDKKKELYGEQKLDNISFFDSAWSNPPWHGNSWLTPYDTWSSVRQQAKAVIAMPVICVYYAGFGLLNLVVNIFFTGLNLAMLDFEQTSACAKNTMISLLACLYFVCSAVLDLLVATVSMGTRVLATAKQARESGEVTHSGSTVVPS